MGIVDPGIDNEQNYERREPFMLLANERWWRNHYDVFIQHGYELRPRYHPDWTPSWAGTKKLPFCCEDGLTNKHPKTMDAKRISDGRRIKMKKLAKGSKELEIARFLTSEEMSKDPRNHCVPILDVFSEEDSHLEFMVMPLLIRHSQPSFSTVHEALDFVKQLLEGLAFMHENGVAHRDCAANNIMMDGDPLYPKGFHPCLPTLDAKGKRARPRRRRDTRGVKYYFTDFGISSRFESAEEVRLVTGQDGLDREVPELRQFEPYDPFPVDVFILGNLFRKELTDMCENMGFLDPLVERMTQQNPCERPTAEEALHLFDSLVQEQSPRSLRWSLVYYDGTRIDGFVWSTESYVNEAFVLFKSFLSFLKRKPLGGPV
ncbi:hypothetical protein A7U60_g916 [Sanghuangporus baumii]|uniref:Protein kinase domain-containing protein n=1 Tax=Sanghuangporus baumii TaxID=108892 RepID=A0A9Q5NBM5_SANBA|nr:hypothetical protein A7U60_g916 [Sanghuangporus baumii]